MRRGRGSRAPGHRFTQVLRALVYQVYSLQRIPALIYQIHGGDTTPPIPLAQQALDLSNSLGVGMYYSTECNEATPFNSRAGIAAALRDVAPEIRDAFDWYQDLTICAAWPGGIAPARENAPVVSAVPALLLTGFYDPVTPSAYGESAVTTLSQGRHVLFPATATAWRATRAPARHGLRRLHPRPARPARHQLRGPVAIEIRIAAMMNVSVGAGCKPARR